MRRRARFLFNTLIQAIYPPSCSLCDCRLAIPSEYCICASCTSSLHVLQAPFTGPRLAHVWFDEAYSAYAYEGVLRDAIHGFKYEQRFDLAVFFARACSCRLNSGRAYDAVIPVPLYRSRLARRGYNQAAVVARRLASCLRSRCDYAALRRVAGGAPQVEHDLRSRLDAVRGVFAVNDPQRVRGMRILLIDDVITTGATINECARVLKRTGARRVDVMSIARTL